MRLLRIAWEGAGLHADSEKRVPDSYSHRGARSIKKKMAEPGELELQRFPGCSTQSTGDHL